MCIRDRVIDAQGLNLGPSTQVDAVTANTINTPLLRLPTRGCSVAAAAWQALSPFPPAAIQSCDLAWPSPSELPAGRLPGHAPRAHPACSSIDFVHVDDDLRVGGGGLDLLFVKYMPVKLPICCQIYAS